ncbi:SDR family NAD(P)-dependent oxidoreductase [Neptunicoccus sediminis]|uniref:SDR family NAD(P)-dependent oxidoreductase n=1 Tax=Neptunicoccus sediminis TaxID=1892596 RepID=UPI000846099A|nr:SDR family NAD(P)-dependent oxidoreductase [Neptunicoccus sediminis]
MEAGKRYWLVGASEGLGRAVAQKLSALGVELALSARSEDRLRDLSDSLPSPSTVHPLDVRNLDEVRRVAGEIGPLDGVVFLAGVYWPMEASEWDSEAVEAMCDINFTGAARVMGAVVPQMIAQDRGHVVLIGSLSGFRGLPGAIGYGASKAAVMHLAEDIHAETVRTNVHVQLVNPGFIKTRLTDKNDFKMPFVMGPEQAADHVVAAMQSRRFQTNFPRVFSWLFRGANFLPATLYYRLFGKG